MFVPNRSVKASWALLDLPFPSFQPSELSIGTTVFTEELVGDTKAMTITMMATNKKGLALMYQMRIFHFSMPYRISLVGIFALSFSRTAIVLT